MRYTIREVSEKTNISAYVLRFYEKEGLTSTAVKAGSATIPMKIWICLD